MAENLKNNPAAAAANWFIETNSADRSDLTHLKIQKLLYFAQGWFLACFGYPHFLDPIEAWKHGPVIRSIYTALRSFKDQEVLELINDFIIDGRNYIISRH